jgi:hypothetical protein
LTEFLVGPTGLIPVSRIRFVDTSELHELRLRVVTDSGEQMLTGPAAIDAVWQLKPSALEGRRFRWIRHAWAFHNLVAHPTMQLLAFVGHAKLGIRLHDATVPRPVGPKKS